MTQDNSWIPVLEESKLKEQGLVPVFPRGLSILLIRKEAGRIYAIANRCAHMACPLSRGSMEGYIIKCPCHDWRFDVRTGEFIDSREIRIPVYPVKVENGMIQVKL